jgi:hypothetical protein
MERNEQQVVFTGKLVYSSPLSSNTYRSGVPRTGFSPILIRSRAQKRTRCRMDVGDVPSPSRAACAAASS